MFTDFIRKKHLKTVKHFLFSHREKREQETKRNQILHTCKMKEWSISKKETYIECMNSR